MKKMNRYFKKNGVLFITVLLILMTVSVTAEHMDSKHKEVMETNINSPSRMLDVTLLDEGFEEGSMPPTGWTTIDTGDNNWDVIDSGSQPDFVHSGEWAAFVLNHYNPQDEQLISPEIDLTEFDLAEITFWAISKINVDFTLELHITGDGFDDIVWDMSADETWDSYEWREVSFTLDSYAGSIIQVIWRYVGEDGYIFALDDILLQADSSGPPPVLDIGEIKGGIAMVQAEIKNTGEGDAQDVQWCITVTGNSILRKINETANGNFSTLAGGGLELVQTDDPLYGLAKLNITVTISALGIEPITEYRDGFLFLIFVIVRAP